MEIGSQQLLQMDALKNVWPNQTKIGKNHVTCLEIS